MFKEIKSIPLATFMSRLGHEPVRRCGDKLWYKSSPKDISIRRIRDGPSTECTVFEGFIDYLSALTLGIIGADAIILNSVSNVNRAIPHLRDYTTIHCYLDNDVAGKTALGQLTEQLEISVIDRSTLYSGYNDLNEYLTTIFTKNPNLQL